MRNRKAYLCILVLPVLLGVSCLHSRTSAASYPVNKTVRINYGSAALRINGQINENIYYFDMNKMNSDPIHYYDNPLINEGTISKNETKYLAAGEEYTFSVLPAEVVTINFTSSDDNDVEISVFEYGKEKKYILEGANRLGLFIAFQNR